MMANSQIVELLTKMSKLSERMHAVLQRLQKLEEQIEKRELSLSNDGIELVQKVKLLAYDIDKKINSLLEIIKNTPGITNIYGISIDKYEIYVGRAEDWASEFEEQAQAESQSTPTGPIN